VTSPAGVNPLLVGLSGSSLFSSAEGRKPGSGQTSQDARLAIRSATATATTVRASAAVNPDGTYSETTGGPANTWTNYTNAGGSQGPTVPAFATIEIACVVQGFRVSDGNTNWYRIAQSPWNNQYYVSADAFYNNGRTSGTLIGTPFVDPSVPACNGGHPETAGGTANTWTNYSNAGGTQGPSIGGGATVNMDCKIQGFRVQDGNTWWYRIASAPWSYQYYVSADAFYNNGQTSGSLVGTPFVDTTVPDCQPNTPPPSGVNETVGGSANTWTDYNSAGGTQGQTIASGSTVVIACKIQGFRVADGNTFWYRIASLPWNGAFYVSADAFYNNGRTSGSLVGTPFYDPNVPDCTQPGSTGGGGGTSTTPPGGTNETAGGVAHTWANYANAGGTQGPDIGSGQTVLIACKLSGFRVADGNTWWYQIAASPWNGAYYVSADAFYNNGHTSGSLVGTPFVDYNIPDCATAGGGGGSGGTGHANGETAGGNADTFGNYSHAGVPGPNQVPGGATVQVTCRVQGFRVADGNTWWYLLASSPWNNVFYVSADAFYNNGATSGSLRGTPFYDPAVPICTNNTEAPLYFTSVATSHSTQNSPTCTYGHYPVNCASGDFWHAFTDLSLGGRGPGLAITRTYNALDPSSPGLFGYGWTSVLDQHLNVGSPDRAADGSIVVTLEDGSQVTATPDGSGGFITPPATDTAFVANNDGTYTLTRHGTILETFSSAGKLVSIGDLNGYKTVLSYNASGQLVSVTDASGRTASVVNGANGMISSITDPMGRTTSYGYDASGNLTSTTDALNRSWAFTYDGSHRMLTMTDPRGGVVSNTYDGQGRVTKQVDPAGLATTFAYTGDNYGSQGGTTTITDPHGNVRLEQYANGYMTTLTKSFGTPGAATWTYTYDPATFGQTSATDPNNHVTMRTYDAHGRLLTSTDATGKQTAITYNPLGEPLTHTTALGETTTNVYDGNGNLVSTTDPAGGQTIYTYGDTSHPGDVTSTTDPDGRVARMTYDIYGDLASKSVSPASGQANTTGYTYDADGEVVCEALPNATAAGVTCPAAGGARVPNTITTSYDAAGQRSSVTDSNGHTTSYSYDRDGNTTSVVDPSGNVVSTTYDADNRLTGKTLGSGTPAAATTSYSYDLAPGSNACPSGGGVVYCTSRKDPNGQATIDAFDGQDNRLQDTAPGSRTTQYAYDLAGNKLTKVDAQGRTTTYGYDADNRLTSVSYSDGTTPSASYSYDADGRRTSMTDGTGTTSYRYDADGRTTSVTNGAGGTTTYAYDHAGNVTSLGYPNGKSVSRTYDGAGRLVASSDWLGSATSFAYDHNGNLVSTTYPNGTTVKSSYDLGNSVTATSVATSKSTLASIAYVRNADELISSETDKGAITGTTAYSYDSRNELLSAAKSQFGYDVGGNLTNNGGTQQTFDAADQLTAASSSAGSTTYGFDQEGDRTSATASWGFPQTYSYNQADQLTSVGQAPVAPRVTSVSPTSGPTAGGTTITVKGTGFSGVSGVTVGGVAASNVKVTADGQLTAVTPAGSAGSGDVVITAPGGTSPTGTADRYSYAANPAVTAMTPMAGPTAGGTTVTISGAAFTGATGVFFGSVPASAYTVVSDNKITATAPAGTGTVAVTVKTKSKTSAKGSASNFLYANGPVITGEQPAAGPSAGGTVVTLAGSGFSGATQVLFGSTPATNLNVVSDSQLTATAPAGSGSIPIYVITPAGTSPKTAIATFGYQAVPTISAVLPAAGPTTGGTTVKISGAGLTNVSGVSFGNRPAAFKVLTSAALLAIAPAGTGTVDITITTAGGTSTKVTADQFNYAAAPTAFSYNGDGLRMSMSTGNGNRQFSWDTSPSVPQLLNDGTASYIYGPAGLPIEQIDGSGTPSYFFHDAVGSTRALLTGSGTVGGTYAYSPYGTLQKSTGSASTPLLYGQGYTDQATGLIYLVNRYYDPISGQFLTVDSDLDETHEPFSYANDDPVNLVDPGGRSWFNPFSWTQRTWDTIGLLTGVNAYAALAWGGAQALGGYASATGTCFAYGWASNQCSDATWHATLGGLTFGLSSYLHTVKDLVGTVFDTGEYINSQGGTASAPGPGSTGGSQSHSTPAPTSTTTRRAGAAGC
jgi:RHS repeat-associated protein